MVLCFLRYAFYIIFIKVYRAIAYEKENWSTKYKKKAFAVNAFFLYSESESFLMIFAIIAILRHIALVHVS